MCDLIHCTGELRRNYRLRIGVYNQHSADQVLAFFLLHSSIQTHVCVIVVDKARDTHRVPPAPLQPAIRAYVLLCTMLHCDDTSARTAARKMLGTYGLGAHAHTIKMEDLSGTAPPPHQRSVVSQSHASSIPQEGRRLVLCLRSCHCAIPTS